MEFYMGTLFVIFYILFCRNSSIELTEKQAKILLNHIELIPQLLLKIKCKVFVRNSNSIANDANLLKVHFFQ